MHFFQGCTALITGASSGLGAEFARQLAPHAACLLLVARRSDRLEELQSQLARPGLTIRVFTADLAQESEIEDFLRALGASGEKVTLLINNAGVGDHGRLEDSEWPRIRAMLYVNINALTRLTHALLPELVRARRGAILNVSSIASLMPMPKMAVYAATKAYVTSFSEGIRAETRGTGVSVTAVCPGPVDTEFFNVAERASPSDTMSTPAFFKVPAEEVVRAALTAVARDRARVIPGLQVAVIMALVSLIPIFFLRLFIAQPRAERSE